MCSENEKTWSLYKFRMLVATASLIVIVFGFAMGRAEERSCLALESRRHIWTIEDAFNRQDDDEAGADKRDNTKPTSPPASKLTRLDEQSTPLFSGEKFYKF